MTPVGSDQHNFEEPLNHHLRSTSAIKMITVRYEPPTLVPSNAAALSFRSITVSVSYEKFRIITASPKIVTRVSNDASDRCTGS